MSGVFPPWLDAPWSNFGNALSEGRLSHALLVAGQAGLSKRELVARMVSRLLCQLPAPAGDACGQCHGCQWLKAGTHPDLFRISPEEDSDSIKVDQIRELITRVQLTAQAGAVRVVVIDPADAMNSAAQNALLKTLEEPASGVHLILIADAPARLLATVRSRCQSLPVLAPDGPVARSWLSTIGVKTSAEATALAAGHPGAAMAYAEPKRAKRAQSVAHDLRLLADGRDSAIAVAKRWSDDAAGHVDDAIAWLRIWSWAVGDVGLVPGNAPAAPAIVLADAYAQAMRVRERLRAPLKVQWLLHEWLSAWQGANRAAG